MSKNTLSRFIGEHSLMFLGNLVGDQGIDHRFTSVACLGFCKADVLPFEVESHSCLLLGHWSGNRTSYDSR
jgi:hypothetical protein